MYVQRFDQKIKIAIVSFLRIWSYLLKISLMENFIFCAVISKISRYVAQHDYGNTTRNTGQYDGRIFAIDQL